jgi:hypothetical protein
MLTTQFSPLIKQLSHSDKLLLLNLLVAELLEESDLLPLPTQNDSASQGLHNSFEAAAILSKALIEHKELVHG